MAHSHTSMFDWVSLQYPLFEQFTIQSDRSRLLFKSTDNVDGERLDNENWLVGRLASTTDKLADIENLVVISDEKLFKEVALSTRVVNKLDDDEGLILV